MWEETGETKTAALTVGCAIPVASRCNLGLAFPLSSHTGSITDEVPSHSRPGRRRLGGRLHLQARDRGTASRSCRDRRGHSCADRHHGLHRSRTGIDNHRLYNPVGASDETASSSSRLRCSVVLGLRLHGPGGKDHSAGARHGCTGACTRERDLYRHSAQDHDDYRLHTLVRSRAWRFFPRAKHVDWPTRKESGGLFFVDRLECGLRD